MIIEMKGMKTCRGCAERLPLAEFVWKSRARGVRHARCSACRRKYQQDWYRRNAQEHKQRAKLARQRRAEENERIIRRAKDVPCADCGQRFAPSQMDFDHVRGIKEFNIGDAKRKVGSERLEAEITKCDVVCAVCHRIRTPRRRRGQDETV